MSRRLDDLVPEMRLKAFELIARCAEQGIPMMIIDTLRTQQEQEANIKNGVSWTKNSKHLPLDIHLPICPATFGGVHNPVTCTFGQARAIDICPYSIFNLDGPDKLKWDADSPVWDTIGRIGESLGLRWGGRWTKRDMGHFELP